MLVQLAGLAVAVTTNPTWSATASVLVLPRPSDDPTTTANLYDTLSRGQVTATLAELLRAARLSSRVAPGAGVSASDLANARTEVSVVPDTSLLDVKVTAPSAATAERVADALSAEAQAYISSLSTPYDAKITGSAAGTARAVGLGRALIALVTFVAAVVAGVAVQQLSQSWSRARQWRNLVAAEERPAQSRV